jgi:hypothetical protein
MTQNLEATYPTIARWVQEYGWIELGQDDMSQSFVRALDDGGMVWANPATTSWLFRAFGEPGLVPPTGTIP